MFIGEGENLGFDCTEKTLSELKSLEPYNNDWESSVDGTSKMRRAMHADMVQIKDVYEQLIGSVKFMSSGRSHVFLVTPSNQLYVCGYNAYSQVCFEWINYFNR